ncbi:MAG: CBS domain-containing protein [Desulfobacterales bacterium]|jgi:CBS domain-containing protein|nr:CBS domain-containing protein [Desulfobacterales bacterium]
MKASRLMISLSECPQIAVDRSLQDAMVMLSAFRKRYSRSEYSPRFVLVADERHRIVGVLRHLEMLRALGKAAGPGDPSLARMVAAAPRVSAREAMTRYTAAEQIDAEASIEEAIGRMLPGALRHMLVVEGETAIGILRLSEIFAQVSRELGHGGLD